MDIGEEGGAAVVQRRGVGDGVEAGGFPVFEVRDIVGIIDADEAEAMGDWVRLVG